MFEVTNKRNMAIPTAVVAAVLMLCAAVLVCSPMSDATGEDLEGYGEVNEIAIAPGYSWSYTATFPSDLEAGTVLTFQVNELNANATIDGHNVSVIIPSDFPAGAYNLVLKAEHADSGQTAYQWIRITVNQALALDYSGCVEEIIQGTAQNITLSSTGGIGTVTWQEVSLPNGLTLSGNTISGTPTQIGENVVQVQAVSDKGETKDLEITFTVYNQIVGGSPQTITSAGSAAASDAIAQTGTDLGVTWAVTGGDLPEGFQLDAATGVVSGTYTGSEPVETTVTLIGTAANGPAQTATKEITIRGEPTFVINGENTVLTYTGNAEAKTLALTASATTSAITWTITEMTGVSVENGTVTVTGEAAVGTAQSATVTATTAYGQVQTKQITITVEDTLAISGPDRLVATAGQLATSTAFSITGGSGNVAAITDNGGYGAAITYSAENNTVSITYPDAKAETPVIITVTSAAGQTATATINVVVYSSMGFDSDPAASGIYAYIDDAGDEEETF